MISSHTLAVAKQHGPAIFRVAASHFQVQPPDCLMIGDNLDLDIAPAVIAGMRVILIDRFARTTDDTTARTQLFLSTRIPTINNLRQLSWLWQQSH